jgi:hypothetical protein
LKKTNQATIAAGDAADRDAILEMDCVRQSWEAAHDYAKKLGAAFSAYKADKQRLVHDSKLGEVEYQKARIASREHNMERYKVYSPACLARLR